MFVPAVTLADLGSRLDEYFALANAEYALPDGTKTERGRSSAMPSAAASGKRSPG
jgi:hypothetical protein